ncbi:MAG: hypothetical protein JST54_09845 [Deltaproteobacteria bacterium]|nr:hypothetical protein [Deltaproteobacteria bacterium]
MSRVKGTAISGRLNYARRRGGEEAVKAIVAGITDREAREQLADGKALKSNWYPFSALVDITVGIDKFFGKGDLSIVAEVGGDVAEADLNGVYKLFFAIASPQYLMDKAASIWRNYYDSGELLVIERAPNLAVLELRDVATPHRAHCLSVQGWMHRSLVLCKCKDVHVDHSECRALGSKRCVFKGSWS